MKRFILISLVFALVGGFILNDWPQPALAKGKYGGILKVGFAKIPMNFGFPPLLFGADNEIAGVCLERLLRRNERGVLKPQLATSWELSPDYKAYTFYLRKGIKFHDGTGFNAEAVKWNLDELLKVKSPTVGRVTSVDVVDDYTVRLNLSAWDNLLLTDLATAGQCFIVSPTALKKNGAEWAKTHPVGTGPFKFKKFKRAESLEYERFDNYREKGLPYLDGIRIITMLDPMTALASLKAKEIQMLLGVDAKIAAELKAKGYYDILSFCPMYHNLFFNSKDPSCIFADKRVRQAVEYAIDKDSICKALGFGFLKPVYECVPGVPEYPDKVVRKYNPDKARQLLAEAGYPDGFKTKILANAGEARVMSFLEAMQASLAKAGIDIKIEGCTVPMLRSISMEGGLKGNLIEGPQPRGIGPMWAANAFFPSASPMSVKEMARTPGLEDLLHKALREKDPDRLKALLCQMDKLAYDDAMLVPFFSDAMIGAVDPSLQDAKLFVSGATLYDLTKAWLSKK